MKKLIYNEPTLVKLGRIVKETHGGKGSKVDGANSTKK